MTFLEEIIQSTENAVAKRQEARSLNQIKQSVGDRPDKRAFWHALDAPGTSVIAEFKRRWPSMKEEPHATELVEVVRAYERGGARAISILTEEGRFRGALDDLRAAREACDLPILRKDFIIDEYQVYEAAEMGADAILLIVAVLQERGDSLGRLYRLARSLGLDALVEVRDERELDLALEIEADLVGINNRDLDKPHNVHFAATQALIDRAARCDDIMFVSESGLSTAQDLEELGRLGIDGALIGTELMMSSDREARCRALVNAGMRPPISWPQVAA